jgi:hypothetical protein
MKIVYRIVYKNIQCDIFVQRSVSEKIDEEKSLNFMQSRVYVVSIQTAIKMLLLVHLEISLLR